ncbi:unknown [Euproctis pseudoconspersa nucleopolyhedrovirus]|uniref:Uncharacterized protein n=1 Tax=Euproctis pseudoconspersa nucleopolyhedrovirus TaxID=307467 RepID=C3TX25_9ABAC|nr:hypothetical protein EupsNPV_gp117 [Euproctis pseudoconspersa nucleopolyhedrovirus]ACO53567.1 unknown [Euproctis pseudoconspersa nucleopolyhedrovirus]
MLSATRERDAYMRNSRHVYEDLHRLRSQLYEVCQQTIGADQTLCTRIKNSMNDNKRADYRYYQQQRSEAYMQPATSPDTSFADNAGSLLKNNHVEPARRKPIVAAVVESVNY